MATKLIIDSKLVRVDPGSTATIEVPEAWTDPLRLDGDIHLRRINALTVEVIGWSLIEVDEHYEELEGS